MPAKIVYGKKKTQHSTNFTKLLSPEKASATVAVAEARGEDCRRQLESAAAEDGGTDLEGLERGVGGLRIDGGVGRGKKEEGSGDAKMSRRNSKSREKKEGGKAKEAAALIEEGLERSLRKLKIGDAGRDGIAKEEGGMLGDGKKKVGRPRKALEMRDANVVKDLHSGGKVKSEEKRRGERSTERRKRHEMVETGDTKVDIETTPQPDTLLRTPKTTPKKKPKRRVECTPASRPQPPQLLTPDPTPEPDDMYTSYISPLLPFSDRKSLFPFTTWGSELTPHFTLSKIAEASFSEVYRLSCTNTTADIAGLREDSVLKVVALKTPPSAPYPCQLFSRAIRDREAQLHKETEERGERDEYKSKVEDVLTEVRLLQTLTPIPGFTRFRSLHLLRGSPSSSPSFCTAWSTWNRARPRGKKSVFPDPSKKSSYDDNQLWAVIEMGDAGSDVESLMEKGGLSTVWEVWDVFWGVVCAVGKGEEGVRFEHRDLHLGNICVRREGDEGADLLHTRVTEPLGKKMRFSGLEATVIDYTLSRADISTPSRRNGELVGEKGQDVAYLDLAADPALFQGDASEEYQYEIYRYMRGLALFGNPLQQEHTPPAHPTPHEEPRTPPRKNTHIRFDGSDDDAGDTIAVLPRRSPRKHGDVVPETPEPGADFARNADAEEDIWRAFHPRTNLIWLHFLLHKLLSHMRAHKTIPSTLSVEQICAPVAEPLTADERAKIKKKATKLYKALERVSEMLCPVALGRDGALGSAKELLVFALEERWVRFGDVEGV